MHLTADQHRHLLTDGYLHLPNLIPSDMIRRALRAINASIGNGMNVADMLTFNSRSFCPELCYASIITDLFNASPARSLAEAAIGAGRLQPVTCGQVALRFPSEPSVIAAVPSHPHLDGMYTPTNGVPAGTIANFTALAGIFLSDLPNENAGNFTVWPGSHVNHAEYFRHHGPQSLTAGMPTIDIGPPRQITAHAGDIILAHYLLGHGVAANVSPHIRYACFFRLCAVDHEQTRWESMCDPWLQWPPMRPEPL
jgi:ectoine hydroxylase-related dioxygenase (phytanoyl-CoA dioxygenase family)